jgi:hypothetical protein
MKRSSTTRIAWLTTITLTLLGLLPACSSDDTTETAPTDAAGSATDAAGEADSQAEPDASAGPSVGPTTQTECLATDPTHLRVGDTTQAACLAPPDPDIVVEDTVQAACGADSAPFIEETLQSECLDELTVGPVTALDCGSVGEFLPDEITLRAEPGRIHLEHVNATHNCCGLIEITAALDGDLLVLTELEVFDDEHPRCRCVCELTVSATVSGLAGGDYQVRVVDADSGDPYGPDVPVTVPPPESVFRAVGGTGQIALYHDGAEHNCCADVAMAFALDGLDIDVWEVETGEMCRCNCRFDLSSTIRDLPGGIYSVQLLDGEGGEPVGDPIVTEVSEPDDDVWVEAVEDTVTIHHDFANWNCCGAVEMQVSVEGDRIEVEEVETYPDGSPCRCTCRFDLSVRASGLEAGDYTVRVFTRQSGEEVVFGEVDVSVPGRPLGEERPEEVSARATDDFAIEVRHEGATYNCCSEIVMVASRDGASIDVVEVITNDELCHCICQFDLSLPLSELPPGDYGVGVTSADGESAGATTVTVTGDELPPPEESVSTDRTGGDITVHHRAVELNCCAEIEMTLEVDGTQLDLVESVTNPDDLCDCLCPFDLSAEVTGLDPESDYTLRLWSDGRAHLIEEAVLPAD